MTHRQPALFSARGWRAVELVSDDAVTLQRLFEENPEYFVEVNGEPPLPTEAAEELHGALPPGWPYTRKWIIGLIDETGVLAGMANVVSDLLAPGVWHIGLLIIATKRHGDGTAHSFYSGLENWMKNSGAEWLRLGVVAGNARAERFWERLGFVDVRKRNGVKMGKFVNTLRVMAKPLAGGSLDTYLNLVARDRPEAH
jgi:RimJ/RimL family protein N-acetyltransferase